MSKSNVNDVSRIVRNYFDEIKQIKYFFEVISVNYDEDDEAWEVVCSIQNLFQEDPREYIVHVDDGTGDILDVEQTEEDE